MFDKVSFPMTKEEKDIEAYKFVLEAFINSPDSPEDIKRECEEKYDTYFGRLPELGNGPVC